MLNLYSGLTPPEVELQIHPLRIYGWGDAGGPDRCA